MLKLLVATGLCALCTFAEAAPLALITNNLDRTVSVINTDTRLVEKTVSVGVNPVGVAIAPDATVAYISNSGDATVSVLALDTLTVVQTIAVGAGAGGMDISADGKSLYVANRDAASVSVIDTATAAVTHTLAVGSNPRMVTLSADGALAFVSNYQSNNVTVIDTLSLQTLATVAVGKGPLGITANPDTQEIYVANQLANSLSVIDSSTLAVTHTITTGARPSAPVVVSATQQVYVSNRDGNTLAVIDIASKTVVKTLAVGDSPHGVAVSHDGAQVYVANYFGDNVSVVNTADYTIANTIVAGNGPFALGDFIVPPPPEVVRSPNIIFLVTDDMNVGDAAFMPQLQTLIARQGITFSNAFVTQSTCCPSRASMLRGQYPHNTGIHRTGDAFLVFKDAGTDSETIATHMQTNGYRTAFFGKYFNDYSGDSGRKYIPPGWSEWYALLLKSFYDYNMNVNGLNIKYGVQPEDYQTDVLAGYALDSVKALATDPRPLFAWIAVSAPHLPAAPADRHLQEFIGQPVPRSEAFNEADVKDKPQWIKDLKSLNSITQDTIDNIYRDRLRSLLAVDDMIGNLVTELAAQGELDNTYFIFTSDNGFQLGEHRLDYGKGTAYDESIRIPLLIRGPGIPAGVTREHLVANNDFMPTMVDLSAGYVPAIADGRSLQPLLSATPPATSAWRQRLLIQKTMDPVVLPQNFMPPHYYAIRDRNFLYVEYPTTGEKEFYDMRTDPAQARSKHKSAPATQLSDYATKLQSLIGCQQQACRTAEDAL